MKVNAIIVAGGKGKRMGDELPKQFINLKGRPILMHTLNQFKNLVDTIYLVLPKNYFEMWNNLVAKHQFQTTVKLIEGGEERFHSVKNALDYINTNELVLIHDGVRPLVSETIIKTTIKAIEKGKGVIPVIKLKDSIRQIRNNNSIFVDRTEYRLVQTPQGFDSSSLKKAYDVSFSNTFTDDASVFEHAGFSIKLIDGHFNNIKITTPEDLSLAESLSWT